MRRDALVLALCVATLAAGCSRLERLSIPASTSADGPATLGEPPAHIPALDVVVENFELRGKKLGRLELQAINHDVVLPRQGAGVAQDWELSHLGLTMPEGTLTATGKWATRVRAPALPLDPRAPRDADDRRRTALDLKVDIRDAGALLKRFDMPGVLSARWCGQHGDDAANTELVLGQLKDVPEDRRGAAFVSVCALVVAVSTFHQ